MNKKQMKAQKIVNGAVSTFSKAITEVEKANGLLSLAVASDVAEMERLTKLVEYTYARLDEIQANKINKEAEIIRNKELIIKLEKFTKGA